MARRGRESGYRTEFACGFPFPRRHGKGGAKRGISGSCRWNACRLTPFRPIRHPLPGRCAGRRIAAETLAMRTPDWSRASVRPATPAALPAGIAFQRQWERPTCASAASPHGPARRGHRRDPRSHPRAGPPAQGLRDAPRGADGRRNPHLVAPSPAPTTRASTPAKSAPPRSTASKWFFLGETATAVHEHRNAGGMPALQDWTRQGGIAVTGSAPAMGRNAESGLAWFGAHTADKKNGPP